MENQLLMAFYGDDFTGSTDALESLSRAGVKTMLFIEPPTAQQLEQYEGLKAIGVAGASRSMLPAEMETVLRPAFQALKALNPRHVHYKVCSTFDSSPTIGSIGKALDIGFEVFESLYVPLLVAAPVLGRHCAFGNLFAKMGIGSSGSIYRLDRHPSMSKHPSTPADESDLRLHLAKQTTKKTGLIDILQVQKTPDLILKDVELATANGSQVILFDAIYQEQLATIGSVIDRSSPDAGVLFSVGSSGIEMALGASWQEQGLIRSETVWKPLDDAGPIMVISGSCSPVSSSQIDYALKNGFKDIALDTEKVIISEQLSEVLLEENITKASNLLDAGFSVIIHTSLGNDDVRVKRTAEIFEEKGLAKGDTAQLYGTALGRIARGVAAKSSLKRIIIAGGDTSSFAARAMGIEAVEMIAPLVPGAPMCKAYAKESSIDGLEVNFKGGQVGSEDYYVRAKGI